MRKFAIFPQHIWKKKERKGNKRKERNALLQKINEGIMFVCCCCSFPGEYISYHAKNKENYFNFKN